ncbi:hypothetical protein J3B00_002567 [Pseudomonas sp. BP8]|nr:hypothetical protein [Pseudomonas sp. BP8]
MDILGMVKFFMSFFRLDKLYSLIGLERFTVPRLLPENN